MRSGLGSAAEHAHIRRYEDRARRVCENVGGRHHNQPMDLLPSAHLQPATHTNSRPERVFVVTGLGGGLARVAFAGVVLLEVFGIFLVLLGPSAAAPARLHHAVTSIGLGDAWGFVSVLAALTIAAQVSASGNQQQGGLRAMRRGPRFTYLAAATGGVALIGWIVLALRFRVSEPGPLALLTIALAGIVFFAADAATVVLSADMRDRIEDKRNLRLRWAGRILGPELYKSKLAGSALVACVTSLLGWCGVIALIATATVAIGASSDGENYPLSEWTAAFFQFWLVLVIVAAFTIPLLIVLVFALRYGGRKYRRLIRIGAFLAVLAFAALPYSLVDGGIREGRPYAALDATFAASVLAVMLFVVSPAIRVTLRSLRWWTPRGAVRLGAASVLRLLDLIDRRRVDLLDKSFAEAVHPQTELHTPSAGSSAAQPAHSVSAGNDRSAAGHAAGESVA